MRGNIMFRYGLVSVLFAVFVASQGMAATRNWDNGGADGKWSTAANWTDDTVPVSGDDVKIGNWASANAISTVDQAGAQGNNIYIGEGAITAIGELQIAGGELHVGNIIHIGENGTGSIAIASGSLLVTNTITFGYFAGASGSITMSGGRLECDTIQNSWNGPGKIVQSGGTNIVRTQLLMGWMPGVLAEYELSGGLLDAGDVKMGGFKSSVGKLTISGGILDLTGNEFNIAYWPTSTGTCYITGGNVTSSICRVGRSGTGSLAQTGGTNSVDTQFLIGMYAGSIGTYSLCGGLLELGVTKMYVSKAEYGQASSGTFLMGDANGTGILRQKGATTTDLTVREAAAADGLIRGWGKVELDGRLVNNGRIIADGYGTDRDLDFTDMTRDLTTVFIANTTNNGWYAQNHGRLLRPPTHNWGSGIWWGGGGSHGMADYKAINSVQFTWSGGAADSITGILYAGDHGLVPAGLEDIIGCWEFSGMYVNADELTFIYDAALAADLSIDENDLLIWRHNGTKWVDVTATSGLDIVNNTITTDSVDANTFFAVATLPPAKGTLIIVQ